MKTGLRTLSVLLIVALLLSVASPVLAQDAEPAVEQEATLLTDAADLAGVWHVLGVDFDFYHEFNEDGTVRAAQSPDMLADSPLFTGEFWFEDGQLSTCKRRRCSASRPVARKAAGHVDAFWFERQDESQVLGPPTDENPGCEPRPWNPSPDG